MQATSLLILIVGFCGQTQSSSPAEHSRKESIEEFEANEAIELAKQEAVEYDFFTWLDGETKLTLHPTPILRWSNLLGRRFYGDVYIWTAKGRPEVVASIHNCYGGRRAMETEIHSLSLNRLTAERGGEQIWVPSRGGAVLSPLPQAVAPAESPAKRLRQMRALAKDFSAVAVDGTRAEWHLRLLTQPLYRYESVDESLLDGALFAFVKGTDPDVFLLLEARRSADEHRWEYALIRFTSSVKLRVLYGGQEVWNVLPVRRGQIRDRQEPYVAFRTYLPSPNDP